MISTSKVPQKNVDLLVLDARWLLYVHLVGVDHRLWRRWEWLACLAGDRNGLQWGACGGRSDDGGRGGNGERRGDWCGAVLLLFQWL